MSERRLTSSSVADQGDEEVRTDPNSSSLPFPASYLILVVRLVFFLLPASFLSFFPVAVRCLRLTSRVTSCQKGFASRRMTAGGWYVAFSCDVSERKGTGSDGYGTNKREREMRSRFAAVRSPLRCCARRAQCYKWPRRYAYPNRPKTCQRVDEKKEKKTFIWNSLIRFSRFRNNIVWTDKK